MKRHWEGAGGARGPWCNLDVTPVTDCSHVMEGVSTLAPLADQLPGFSVSFCLYSVACENLNFNLGINFHLWG